MSIAERITRHYGGNWNAGSGQGCIPGDGHSKRDRSVSVKDEPDRPDGILVHCHGAGDWRAEIDRFRRDRLLPAFDPKQSDHARELTPAEREKLDREQRDAKAKREAEQQFSWEAAACDCDAMWGRAQREADPAHPYLVLKGIPGEGLRQLGDLLLVPMRDHGGGLWNVQRIWPDGRKLYAKGGRADRLMLVIGAPRDRLVVAEGYANAAVVRRATGWPVAVAFTWKNLAYTAKVMRRFYPAADIVLAADDDAHLVDNPSISRNLGLEAARAAAEAIGGRLAVPPRLAA